MVLISLDSPLWGGTWLIANPAEEMGIRQVGVYCKLWNIGNYKISDSLLGSWLSLLWKGLFFVFPNASLKSQRRVSPVKTLAKAFLGSPVVRTLLSLQRARVPSLVGEAAWHSHKTEEEKKIPAKEQIIKKWETQRVIVMAVKQEIGCYSKRAIEFCFVFWMSSCERSLWRWYR